VCKLLSEQQTSLDELETLSSLLVRNVNF
jgi:hypothetical protein